jgi:hypothetical protein
MAPARQRQALIAAAVLLLAAALAVVVATRGDAASDDTTAKLVPADALLYVHLSTAEARTQDARLRKIADRFATVRAQLPKLAAAITPAAASLNLAKDLRPWVGDDVAVALLSDGRPLLVASVRDQAAAERTLGRLGARGDGSYKGVALRTLPPATSAAFTDDHLVVGPVAAVRGAIDRASGDGSPSLSRDRVFRRAAATRTGASSVDVYAPVAGVRRLLGGRQGIAGAVGRLLATPTLEGVHAQVAAEESGVRVSARMLRAPGGPRPAAFAPTLAARVPADSAGFLALPGLDAAADAIARLGGTTALDAITAALPDAAGVELEDLLAPLSDEAQLTVTTGEAAPVFTVAARTRDEASTRESLAQLQGPLGERLAGGAPFTQFEQGGVPAFALPVTGQLEPTYAIGGGALVASTARSGLSQLARAKAPVTGAAVMKEVMPSEGKKVGALGFLDSRQLLALAERTGLQALGSTATRDDLGRIRSAGAVVEQDGDHPTDTTAELFLQIP